MILLFNGYMLDLVLAGDLSPVSLAVFAILDIIALSAIGNLAVLAIPVASRVGNPMNDQPLKKIAMISSPRFSTASGSTPVWLAFQRYCLACPA